MIWACNAIVALGAALLWAVDSPSAGWLTALLVLMLLNVLLRQRVMAWRMYASRTPSVDGVRLGFMRNEIMLHSRVEESRFPYEKVTGIRENEAYMVLYLHHHTPLLLCKDDIAGGYEGLRNHLLAKTGLEIRSLG